MLPISSPCNPKPPSRLHSYRKTLSSVARNGGTPRLTRVVVQAPPPTRVRPRPSVGRGAPRSADRPHHTIDVCVLYGLPAVRDSRQMKTVRPDRARAATTPSVHLSCKLHPTDWMLPVRPAPSDRFRHLAACSSTGGYPILSPGVSSGVLWKRSVT